MDIFNILNSFDKVQNAIKCEETSTLRLRNIHDKIGGKSEGEEFIHAEASDTHRAE
jgi:hypothetical protein